MNHAVGTVVLLPTAQQNILEIDTRHKRIGQEICTRRFLDRLYNDKRLTELSEKRWRINGVLRHRGHKVGYVVSVMPLKSEQLRSGAEQHLADQQFWLPIHYFYRSVQFPMSSIEAPPAVHQVAVRLRERLRHFTKKSRTYSMYDWSALEHVAWKIAQCTSCVEWIMTALGHDTFLVRGLCSSYGIVIDLIIYVTRPTNVWSIPLWTLHVMVHEQQQQQNKSKRLGHHDDYLHDVSQLWQHCMRWCCDWLLFLQHSINQEMILPFNEIISERKRWMKQAEQLSNGPISEIRQRIAALLKGDSTTSNHLPKDGFIIMVNDYYVKIGKIARYIARDLEVDGRKLRVGHICICSKALRNQDYLENILAHELVHAAIPNNNGRHDEEFQNLASAIGVPQHLQK